MRIAYFTDTYKPQVNGVTYAVEALTNYLKEHGHSIYLYSPKYPQDVELITENVSVKTSFAISLPGYKDIRIAFPNLFSILRDIMEFNPDIIHVHTPANVGLSGIFISKLLRKPLVCTFHNHPSAFVHYLPLINKTGKKVEKLSEEVLWQIFAKIFGMSSLILCPTAGMKIELQKRIPSEKIKIEVLSNAIDTNLFSPDHSVEKQKNSLIFVGRLAAEKRIEILIEAFSIVAKKIPDSTLNIVGDGPLADYLKKFVSKLNLENKVFFHGFIEHNKLNKIYNESELFVITSPNETQGLVILEAMSCGLPAIALSNSGVSDAILPNENGLLVAKLDANNVAEKILLVLSNREILNSISLGSRESVLKFSLPKIGNRLEELYLNLLQQHVKD